MHAQHLRRTAEVLREFADKIVLYNAFDITLS